MVFSFLYMFFFLPRTCCIGKCQINARYYPKRGESDFEAVISCPTTLTGDKVLYHCRPCTAKMQGVTVCAGKLFNREAVSPVKLAYLSSPRFSVSVPFLLAVEVFSTIKRDLVDPFASRFSYSISSAKAKHFQVSIRFESHSFGDNLSRSCERQRKSLWLHCAFEYSSRVLISLPPRELFIYQAYRIHSYLSSPGITI